MALRDFRDFCIKKKTLLIFVSLSFLLGKSEKIEHTSYRSRIHTHTDVIIRDITAVKQRNRKPTPMKLSHDFKPVPTKAYFH